MSKCDVIKKLTFLAVIGAVVGALIVFLKNRSVEEEDIFEDDNIEDSVTCPGCRETERSYTTISKEVSEEAPATSVEEQEEATTEESSEESTEDTSETEN